MLFLKTPGYYTFALGQESDWVPKLEMTEWDPFIAYLSIQLVSEVISLPPDELGSHGAASTQLARQFWGDVSCGLLRGSSRTTSRALDTVFSRALRAATSSACCSAPDEAVVLRGSSLALRRSIGSHLAASLRVQIVPLPLYRIYSTLKTLWCKRILRTLAMTESDHLSCS
ncbi:hypothetical protein B0H11DRAFT_2230103 [Mycena galericulata]|nr:hypothetical protein B0H11DRAFT_2230103 [Mycena galericulata]